MATSDNHLAHPYVDIAHRAALMYSFATLLIAVFVELSAWPTWINLTSAAVVVFFFLAAIFSYIAHGAMKDTDNQFESAGPPLHLGMFLLILGEVGGFAVLLAGFVKAPVLVADPSPSTLTHRVVLHSGRLVEDHCLPLRYGVGGPIPVRHSVAGEMDPVALHGGGHRSQSAAPTDRGQGRGECIRTPEDRKQFGGVGSAHADESEQARRKIVAVTVGRSYL
eukprot:gene27445-33117_t